MIVLLDTNGNIVYGPGEWDVGGIMYFLTDNGIRNISLPIVRPALPQTLGPFTAVVVTESYMPGYNSRIETISTTDTVVDGTVRRDYAVVSKPLDVVKADFVSETKSKTRQDILSTYPDYVQWNAALGLLTEPRAQQTKAGIRDRRDACNAKEAAILAAATNAEALAAYLA